MAVWLPLTAAVERASAATVRAAAKGGRAAGRQLGRAGAKGTQKAGQAGARGAKAAGRAGGRGAGAAGHRGIQGAGKGARAAGHGGTPANGGLRGGARAGAGRQPKGGWARGALRDAGGRGGGGLPSGPLGRGGTGSAEGAAGDGDGAGLVEDAGRRWLRNRFRHRRGPFKRSRRRVRRILIVALSLLAILPFMTALYGAEAATEAEEVVLTMQCAGAPLDRMSEETEIPPDALVAYCSAATAWEVDWAVLAGMGKLECDHGRSPDPGCPRGSVNECGARGPMQFLGNTWRSGTDPVPSGECPGASSFTGNPVGPPIPEGEEAGGYATDGGDDNIADPWDWRDATHAAARYLLRNGLKEDERGAIYAYNQSSDYVARVQELAAGYRAAVPNMSAGENTATVGGCPSVERRGGTEPITESSSTAATRAMANAVIACFGRGHGIGCYSPRLPEAKFEHPRGRACDFMLTSGGVARDEERSRGQAMAEWVAANAAELNVIYVIWYNRSWNPSDGNIPWNRWSDYGCGGCDPSAAHYNHVHVSVKLQPGDPDWAHCMFRIPCTE